MNSARLVACVRRHDDASIHDIWKSGNKIRNSCLLSVKRGNESLPNILVTRNPNWSQRSGTKTDCVKERYYHPKYTIHKISCIV
jgi:hypothetical protein